MIMRDVTVQRTQCEGFALVAVLVFLMAVSAIVAPLALTARTDFVISSRAYFAERQTLMASSLTWAIARQLAALPGGAAALPRNSSATRTVCGTRQVTVRIQDQNSLVNLNTAGRGLLTAGFEAIGLDNGQAVDLARIAMTYRDREGGDGAVDSVALSDGFKFARFEAIEELHEFSGLEKAPTELLARVFTVHGFRSTIVSANISVPLGAVVLQRPVADRAYLVADEGVPRFFRIDVNVREASRGVTGDWGAIIEIASDPKARFRLVERVRSSGAVDTDDAVFHPTIACDALFGEDISAWLSA